MHGPMNIKRVMILSTKRYVTWGQEVKPHTSLTSAVEGGMRLTASRGKTVRCIHRIVGWWAPGKFRKL